MAYERSRRVFSSASWLLKPISHEMSYGISGVAEWLILMIGMRALGSGRT